MIFDKLYVFWVILLLILDLTILALKLPQLQGQNIELVSDSLTIEYTPIHRRRRSLPTQPPEEIHTKCTINGDKTILKFSRAAQQRQFNVHYYRHGIQSKHVSHTEINECKVIYVDVDSKATALVDFCEILTSPPPMMIELQVNSSQHVIMTSSSPGTLDQIIHTLYRVGGLEPGAYSDNTKLEKDQTKRANMKDKSPPGSVRHRRGTAVTNTVELLLVVDYSLYKFWYDQTSGTNRQQQAIDNIRTFYAFNVAAMDLRYQGLASADVAIRVKLVDLIVMTTPQDSPWIEGNLDVPSLGPRGSFSGNAALNDFDTWITNQKATNQNFPKFDHAQLLTARDLQLDNRVGAAGYANLGAICTGKSQSVVEDHFNFLSVTIQTHELGHSLGAVHDGDDNSCRKTDYFIMTSENAVMPGPTAKNPWLFSACSGSEIRNKLTQLDSNGGSDNCLVTQDSSTEVAASGDQLGQRYPPDTQCSLNFGTQSFVCKSRHISDNYSTLCTGLWCALAGKLNNCTLVIPADGTTCGNKMWCVNGECVSSTVAPTVDETCMFGDQLGIVQDSSTCASIVTAELSSCYYTSVRRTCCASCESQNTNIPGCEYGDTSICTAITAANAWNCYNSSFSASACCQTCHNLKRTDLPATCLYGDILSNCVATDSMCQRYPTECCDTCKDFNTASTTTRGTATTTTTTTITTTTEQSEGTEAWIIAVAAGGGAVVLIAVIIAIVICCRQSNSQPKPRRGHNHHRNHDRHNIRHRDKPPPYGSHMGSGSYVNNAPGIHYGGHRTRY